MVATPRARRPGRPRGGSEDVVHAILTAAAKQLADRGLSGLSIEEIARDAGVNKTSVYRRWPTKVDLVLATFDAMRPTDAAQLAPSGNLREDLLCLLQRKVALISAPGGRTFALSLLALGTEEGAAPFVARLVKEQHKSSEALFRDATKRGELPDGTVPRFLSELLLSPVVQRAVVAGERVDSRYLARLVDHVLRGAGWTGPTR